MTNLNLPEYEFRLKVNDGVRMIWDEFRKKYVVLTPEEWVRQNFLKFLNIQLGYPKALIKTEFEISYNQLKKRPDIVAYDRSGHPLLVVECKAPEVEISERTFQQAAIYNQTLNASYIVVTNGMNHYCCEKDKRTGTFLFVKKIPVFIA